MSKPGWLHAGTVLLAALSVGGCGVSIDTDADEEAARPASTVAATPTAAATVAQTATAEPTETPFSATGSTKADRDETLKLQAQGTADAFIQAVEDEDVQVLCGIVNPNFLRKFFEGELSRASCLDAVGKREFKAFQAVFEGAETQAVEVDYPVAAVTIKTGPDTASVAIMRRNKSARWVIRDLRKPGA